MTVSNEPLHVKTATPIYCINRERISLGDRRHQGIGHPGIVPLFFSIEGAKQDMV